MPRHVAAFAVSATIAACLAAGCGPTPTAAPTSPTTPAAPAATPPTGLPPAPGPAPGGQGQPAARKTFTRDEIKKWWNDAKGKQVMSTDDVKKWLGLPETTYEKEVPTTQSVPGYGTTFGTKKLLVFRYTNLTVDAAGSGKVDRETLFMFEGKWQTRDPEFIP